MRAFVVLSVIAALETSCDRGTNQTAEKESLREAKQEAQTPEAKQKPAKPDPCGAAALNLKDAKALTTWQPPPGCMARGDGVAVIRSEDELKARLECPAGVAAGVDFTKQALLVDAYMMSPASTGVIAYDDGKVVTLVSRQRSPCPNDPQPMPMNATAWFVVPGGGARTTAEAVCTVESTCR